EFLAAGGPLHSVDARAAAAAVSGHLEPGRRALGPAGVDRQHDALRAETPGRLAQQFGPGDRGGVDGHLVGTGPQQPVDVLAGTHAAPDGERDEHLLGRAPDDVIGGLAVAGGGGDVEEGQLVRAFGVVPRGELDRVARVAQVLEVDALDHPAGVDVQTRDDPHSYTHAV